MIFFHRDTYRVTIGDGEETSTNVFIVDNLQRVEEELLNKIKVIMVDSNDTKLHNGCVLLIFNWKVVQDGPQPWQLGPTAENLVDQDFLRSLRKGTGCLTPSRMRKTKHW